jgi:transposase-like protein
MAARNGHPRGTLFVWGPRKADIARMYLEEGVTQAKIAEMYNVSTPMVHYAMKRLGIKARPRWRSGKENGRYIDGRQSRGYRKVIEKKQCSRCPRTTTLGIHHKNDDHFDNAPENLEVLCNSCHMSITKKKWWDAKRRGEALPKSNAPLNWTTTHTSARGPQKAGLSKRILTWDRVRKIRGDHAAGKSLLDMAAEHSVSVSAVRCVVMGQTWREPATRTNAKNKNAPAMAEASKEPVHA